MAKLLANELSRIEGIIVNPSQTHSNMVFWSVQDQQFDHKQFQEYMLDCKIKCKAYDEDTHDYRFVIYSGIREQEI